MDIFELNKPYKLNNNNGIIEGNNNYKIIDGINPFILSAPHAVKQFREGKVKVQDELTGGIVEGATKLSNTNGIIRTFNMHDDPNYDSIGYGLAYKNAMIDLIKRKEILYSFDIHGCKNSQNFDIDIGTNEGINIGYSKIELEIIKEILSSLGKVCVDAKFKSKSKNNISNYVHAHTNIPCFQFEISKEIRVYETQRLLELLNKIVNEIMKEKDIKVLKR